MIQLDELQRAAESLGVDGATNGANDGATDGTTHGAKNGVNDGANHGTNNGTNHGIGVNGGAAGRENVGGDVALAGLLASAKDAVRAAHACLARPITIEVSIRGVEVGGWGWGWGWASGWR